MCLLKIFKKKVNFLQNEKTSNSENQANAIDAFEIDANVPDELHNLMGISEVDHVHYQ
jgi:hypothetical protein